MSPSGGDVYQDGLSEGSLAKARRQWLDLVHANVASLPQRFAFVFHCPTGRMALDLSNFLQYAEQTGRVYSADRVGRRQTDVWQVSGTTPTAVWSLSRLERLFMQLRGAGPRFGSTLMTLDVGSMARSLA